ncbi:unnamed protein product [Diabrotica balteata]|uniref:Uncharacterized protein n=1 Tax=Diabrotica balteata TaxID=107213 RepID=A0A9N9XB02_DIABA|nr:unnamed protein product [Diabrotica balteata]
MKLGILFIGLVALVHHSSAIGCSSCSSCHGSYGHYHEEHHGGCGFRFPCRKQCNTEELPQSDWCGNTGHHCVPLVVRPHDLPKPNVNPGVEVDLSCVKPNPCAIKKAIVKPAVLPKPVCKHHHRQSCGCDNHHQHHSCCGSLHGSGPCYGHGPIIPHGGVIGSNGNLRGSGIVGISGGPGAPGYGYGPLSPADSVSLDLAYKLAREADLVRLQSEDKLNFGFRKIPIELPPKKIIKANVPEEGIFNLNGQIVELTPIRASAGNSPAALAEEAAEQLLALEEEEAEALANGGSEAQLGVQCPIRKVALCEIGYKVAKPPKPCFTEVPACKATCHGDVSTNCGCGHYGQHGHHHHGCGGHACGQIGGCVSCGGHKCDCKIIPGDVKYECKPKPQQICLKPPVVPDSCESAEIEIEEDDGHQVKCACVPVCVKQHHCNHSCKKTCVTIEKLC